MKARQEKLKAREAEGVFGTSVDIIVEGKRHLGVVIGQRSYKNEYCGKKVTNGMEEVEID